MGGAEGGRSAGRRPPRRGVQAAGATGEDPAYLSRQLLTCIGNKRALLGPIGAAVERVKRRLGRERIACFDPFAGSGVVSRFLKGHATRLVSNDLEPYAAVTARCFLADRGAVDRAALAGTVAELNARVDRDDGPPGFIAAMYAPRDERSIAPGERVFYTPANARRLDAFRQAIAACPAELHDFLLGPLLAAASVHANTAGVFKGFYKDRRTGIGRLGGSGADALGRITGTIRLEAPLWSRFDCPCEVFREDANALAPRAGEFDLVYLDPPYNQHPYGSNYFLLNLLVDYRRPGRVSPVAGIPPDWNRSGYNVRARAAGLLSRLVADLRTRFLLVSSSDEGFVRPAEMRDLLGSFGPVDVVEIPYAAFRGSRNLATRPGRVTEHLFLVEMR